MTWKRYVLIFFGVLVGTLAILMGVNWLMFEHWAAIHTGTLNESGPYYGFWSGFGSDLGEATLIATVATGAIAGYRKINCHTKGCWRIGHHELVVKHSDTDPGTVYKVCRHCHPEIQGKRFSRGEIHAMHVDHRIRNLGHRLEDVLTDEQRRTEQHP